MKAKLLNSRKLFVIIAVILLAVCILSVISLRTDAAELEGKRFTAAELYEMHGNFTPNGPITFEAELYVPDAYKKADRVGAIVSNYNYKDAFAFEIRSGKVFVFIDNGTCYLTIDYDITQHMGTDADPKYAKIAVTVDTATGVATLFVNGKNTGATITYTGAAADMYNTTQTLVIGGDRRSGNSSYFKGVLKNLAMYKGMRTADEIAKDHSAAFYDTSDSDLLFAYDLTEMKDGMFIDRSQNKNHASNKNWKPAEGTAFSQTANIPYVTKDYTEVAYTYEAVVFAPRGITETGTIISNYPDAGGDSFIFQVRGNGQPSIYIWDEGKAQINHKFNYDIRRSTFVHLAITHETVGADTVFKCYVDGELVDSVTVKDYVFTLDAASFAKTRKVSIGQCGRANLYWKGSIKSITLHNKALTADEIRSAYLEGTNAQVADVFAYYDMTYPKDGFIEDNSGNGYHANYNQWAPTEGRTFTETEEPVYMTKDLDVAPYTYEAVIYAPMGVKRPGVMIGNYPNDSGDSFQFEIKDDGKPGIYIYENGKAQINRAFNYDVRRNAFVHVAITHETVGSDTVFKCYVDGELVDSFTVAGYVFTMDMQKMKQTGPIALGACVRTSLYWHGNMKNLALHNRALSAEEIKASYEKGVEANKSSLILYYNTTGEQATSDVVIDQTGNGYDMAHLFYEKDFTTVDYDYSFAVVGDTQFMVYQDAVNGTNYTEYIYNWIVDNYGEKKMKYVFGLGDIIDNGKLADGTGSASVEWAYAKNLIVNKLGVNNIPYSVIGGNHDFMRPWDTGFNANFKDEATLTKNITGYYQGSDVYNYYMNFEVEGTPYMLLALEYGANDDILAWANDVVAANRHRRVIVTTHGYMYSDGTTIDGGDYAAPKPTGTTNEHYLKYNNGDEMWDEFVRKHPNITLVLSGHIDYNNIVMREDKGDYGNTVHQFLIDPQKMDRAYGFKTGMVAMLYFRNGGKDVSVEYVSTYRTAENSGKEVLFNRANQFDFTIEEAPAEQSRGEINVWLIGGQSNAVGYAEGLTPEQLSDSRYEKGFDNVLYYGYGERWQSTFAPVKLGYGLNSNTSGAELGIAAALGNTGEMNAIIKYAQGATALYPVTDSNAAKNHGTWTSPSYITDKNVSTDGNKTGDLYVSFINTVESAVAELRRMGYTPVIKGMWWMQGEEETYNGGADSYAELLSYLAGDVRSDLTELIGSDMSKMPFVIGKVYTEKRADLIEGINKVQEQQALFVSSDPYAALVSPKDCPEYDTQDQWHFNASTQSYLGSTFVKKANAINGDYIVEIIGKNVTAIGGGLYKKGETVNVTFDIADTYELNSLEMKIGSDNVVSIKDSLDGMSYSFTCEDNTTFTANASSDAFVETEYGDIPIDYSSAELYPVALFGADKSFIGVYQNVTEATNRAMENPSGNYVILMRNNVSQTNGSFISGLAGSITLDLGGFTLTKASTAYILECYYNGGAFDGGKLTVKNGSLVNCGWSAFFCFNYGASLSGNVYFDFEFDNVTFCSEFTAETGKNVIFETWDNGGATASAVNAEVVFNDCVFDYTASASGEIMLGLTWSQTRTVFNVTINGGKIVTDRTIGISELANKDTSDTVKFGKGTDGYTVCAIKGGSAVTNELFAAKNGETLAFSEGVASGEYTVYELKELDTLATDYGRIDPAYSSVSAYPFAVFYKLNGSYVFDKGYVNYNTAMVRAIELTKADGTAITDDVVLLLRCDFHNTGFPSNLSDIGGAVTIDLNGCTLIAQTSMGNTGTDDCGTNKKGIINIKNGKLLMMEWGIIFAAKGTTYANETPVKTLEFNLTNVYVGFATGANSTALLINDRDLGTGKSARFNMNLVDCTLDMVTNAPSGAVLGILNFSNRTQGEYAVTIKGGNIIADKTAKLGFTANSGDSITLLPDDSGKYTTVTLPTAADMTSVPLNTTEFALIKGWAEGSNTVYTFTPAKAEETEYGTIPAMYTNGDLYPFVVFQGGKFYIATRYFGRDNSSSALSYGKVNGTVILMRADFTYNESQYNNLSQTYSITIDLGGYTFKSTDRIVFSAQKKTTNDTALNIKNGTFLLGTKQFMTFSSWDPSTGGWAAYPGGNGFDFIFDNINIVLAEDAPTVNIMTANSFKSTDPDQFCNLTFNNCVFDLRASANENVLLFDFTNALCAAKVIINGGEILTNGLTLADINGGNASSGIAFGKLDGGNYMTVTLPKGIKAPSDNLGELVFVKISGTDEAETYRLIPKEIAAIDFTPKMSLTLDQNLVMNVYIPAERLVKFTFNGIEYANLSEIAENKVTLDGKDYYLVKVELPSAEAAKTVKLIATVSVGEKTATGTFTFSVIKYSEKVIATGSDVEVTLVKDVLSYVRAAYAYFGTKDSEAIAAINAILGEGYDEANAPKLNGSSEAPSAGLSAVTFVLDATPAIRFYITESAESYAFYVGTSKLKTVVGSDANGTYVEMDVYAYAMCETITYFVDGEQAGTYHINSYYTFVTTDEAYKDNAELINLVARFAKYCESARDYRDSVVAG